MKAVVLNLISCAIWALLLPVLRALLRQDDGNPAATGRSSGYGREVIVRQFRICLPLMVVCIVLFFSVKAPGPLTWAGLLKVFALIVASLCYFLLIGAFDAALDYQRTKDELVKGQGDEGVHEGFGDR